MMESERFRLFSVLLVLGLVSCASCAMTRGSRREGGSSESPDSQSSQSASSQIRVELSKTEVMTGTLVRIRVVGFTPRGEEGLLGRFEGIEFPFYSVEVPLPQGGSQAAGYWETLLGIPYERKAGPAKVDILRRTSADQKSEPLLEVPFQVIEGAYRSEVLQVDHRRVSPTRKKDLIRIKKEQAEIGAIYRKVSQQKHWKGPFMLPIESAVTSPFGTRRVYNGQLQNYHSGLDLRAPLGTPIFSTEAGEVVLAKDLFFSGKTVIVDHGFGLLTLYAHMSKIGVQVGQKVASHELLGLSGKTGRVNGPHLHWTAIVHRVKVNPEGLIQLAQ